MTSVTPNRVDRYDADPLTRFETPVGKPSTMSTPLKVLTYNTHLFGSLVGWISGVGWKDSPERIEALKAQLQTSGADLIGLQEVWDSDLVHRLTEDGVGGVYPGHYYHFAAEGLAVPSNAPGLLLLAKSRIELQVDQAQYFDYIHRIGVTRFDPLQDAPTGKGFLRVPAVVGGSTPLTLLVTHLPTGSHEYSVGVNACFEALARAVPDDASRVLLMGDLNIAETAKPITYPAGSSTPFDRYQGWVGKDGTLGRAGLRDSLRVLHPDPKAQPGYSVVGSTNTCWRHFNRQAVAKNEFDWLRIDYFMVRGLTPLEVAVQGTPPPPLPQTDYSDTANPWVWFDEGTRRRDLSDHYPLNGSFNL